MIVPSGLNLLSYLTFLQDPVSWIAVIVHKHNYCKIELQDWQVCHFYSLEN